MNPNPSTRQYGYCPTRFGGFRLFRKRQIEPVNSDKTQRQDATPNPLQQAQGDILELKLKPIETYSLIQEGNPKASPVTLDELLTVLDQETPEPLEKLLEQKGIDLKGKPVLMEDSAKHQVRAIFLKNTKGERVIWADFNTLDHHPLLDKLSKKFKFASFREVAPKNEIPYELPTISKGVVQVTAYGMGLTDKGEINTNQKLHMYVGKNFMVTTHNEKWPTVNKTFKLLRNTGTYKSPSDLMSFILKYTVNRYDNIIESLKSDFTTISEKISKKKTDDTLLEDSVFVGRKIDGMYETAIRQKEVLQELLSLNEFHNSELIPARQLDKLLRTLDNELRILDHYQERKNGLIDLYRAKISNDMDDAMKRLAAISIMFAPATVMGGMYGMNVALPFAENSNIFYLLVGGMAAVTGGLFAMFKRKKWI